MLPQSIPELRQSIATTEQEIERLKFRLNALKREIDVLYTKCNHHWETKYTPIHHEGYHISGDAPGTMGIDWRGPSYEPPRTEHKWTRTCTKCGKTETTTKSSEEQVVKTNPIW